MCAVPPCCGSGKNRGGLILIAPHSSEDSLSSLSVDASRPRALWKWFAPCRRRLNGQGLHHDRGVPAGCVVCGASAVEAALERQTLEYNTRYALLRGTNALLICAIARFSAIGYGYRPGNDPSTLCICSQAFGRPQPFHTQWIRAAVSRSEMVNTTPAFLQPFTTVAYPEVTFIPWAASFPASSARQPGAFSSSI